MSNTLRIKKGVDIRLTGEPSLECGDAPQPKVVAIQPTDFPGLTPKLAVKEEPKFRPATPCSTTRLSPQ